MLGVGTISNYVAVLFYAGYIHVFLEFCKVFESGGIGKNGSTIAVSFKNSNSSVIYIYIHINFYIYLHHYSGLSSFILLAYLDYSVIIIHVKR